jgi:Xaa-Pro dipeptidase
MESELLPGLSLQERDRRWAEVRRLMERDGLDAIITSPNTSRYDEAGGNTRYLSQIGGNAVGAVVVFPREGEVTAIVGHVPGPEFWAEAFDWVTDLRDMGFDFAYAPVVAKRLKELGLERGRIGLAGLTTEVRAGEGTFLYGMVERLREELPDAALVGASETLQDARYVKGDEEVEALRRAVENAEAMVERMVAEARPGVPENVIWGRMVSTLVERGGDVPTVLLWHAGPKQQRNHFSPTRRELQAGDVITVEADGRYMGYNGMVTTHAFVGPIPSIYQELHAFQQELLQRCWEMLKPGATVGDFEELHRSAVEGTDYNCRIVMHGRGLGDDAPVSIAGARDKRMAEWPVIENAVFALKPRVGTGGPEAFDPEHFVGWGDTVVATPGGARRLGTMPAELIEIPC